VPVISKRAAIVSQNLQYSNHLHHKSMNRRGRVTRLGVTR
jgi:hypothetical protein